MAKQIKKKNPKNLTVETEDPKANLILIAAAIVSFTPQASVFSEMESSLQHYKKETEVTSNASGFQFPNSAHELDVI